MARNKNPRTWAKDRVARFIAVHIVGFRFDYDSAERAPLEPATDQFPCAAQRVALKERTFQHGYDLLFVVN
jgi:hypothetical protein